IVYDSRIFQLPEGANIAERLHAHILTNPVGREIFRDAHAIEGDVHAFSALPYYSQKVCGDGWACVGDAAGCIDPLYRPGSDFCSYTSNYVPDFVARNLMREDVTASVAHHNEQYPIMYRSWLYTLSKDKYSYLADHARLLAG